LGAIEDLETPQKICLFREGIYPLGKFSYKSLTLDKSIQRIEDAVMETLSQTPQISSRHLQYRYLSCRWWFYVARIGQEFQKRLTCFAEDPFEEQVWQNLSKFKSILIK
jgi:hypothetical protein